MSSPAAIPVFLVSLAVTLASARVFARRLDKLGLRFGLPEAVIGLFTALAADGPEVSSALFALIKGKGGVSAGVLVGSNVFNLAAMIGVSGLLAGQVRARRQVVLLEGLAAAAITLIGAAVLLRWLPAGGGAGLGACVLVPYLFVVIRAPRSLAEPPPERERRAQSGSDPTHHLLGLILLDVVLIVAGSAGMVQAALALADHWHVSGQVLGVLILAPLTSIPNALTAIRLGLAGRSAALVGETFNSNTINLAAGVILPALFVAPAVLSGTGKAELAWLIATTAACLVLLAREGGMGRATSSALIAGYLGFVVLQLVA